MAHIGNLRAYIFADVLQRTCRYLGYEVNHVINITDVGHLVSDESAGEDKMEKGARITGKSPYDVAREFENLFFEDIAKLNIEKERFITPRATEHIKEQLLMIKELERKGFTYETSDGIYFDTSKFESYGKLSKQKLGEKLAGARVEENTEKRNPTDFALWKFCVGENLTHTMRWDFEGNNLSNSPITDEEENRKQRIGFPGWHIECSAMSAKYLGNKFDIHTGGIDHIPVHHENEIAQSEAVFGEPFVNYWMHNEFVLIDNGKMSKSLGNVYNLDDLKEKFGISPIVFRFFCLMSHYRSPLNFTKDGIEAAKSGYVNLKNKISRLDFENNNQPNPEMAEKYKADFIGSLSDDLNTPKAIATLFEALDDQTLGASIKKSLCLDFDRVFGLNLIENNGTNIEVQELIQEREEAKKAKQFDKADEIRQELAEKGYLVEDTPKGPIFYKKTE